MLRFLGVMSMVCLVAACGKPNYRETLDAAEAMSEHNRATSEASQISGQLPKDEVQELYSELNRSNHYSIILAAGMSYPGDNLNCDSTIDKQAKSSYQRLIKYQVTRLGVETVGRGSDFTGLSEPMVFEDDVIEMISNLEVQIERNCGKNQNGVKYERPPVATR